MVKKLFRLLGLAEKRCCACKEGFDPDEGIPWADRLCAACRKPLAAYEGPRCQKCGVPWDASPVCPQCRKEMPPWAGIAYHGLYEGLLRELILRLKFSADLAVTPLLADFLLQACQNLPAPDYLIAIPQFTGRLRERGFNQAHETARLMAKSAGFAYRTDLLLRIKAGPPQEGLSAAERKANMQDVFRAHDRVAGQTIWLIDDVLTTGSTCASAARCLLAKGAQAVYLLVIARTPL